MLPYLPFLSQQIHQLISIQSYSRTTTVHIYVCIYSVFTWFVCKLLLSISKFLLCLVKCIWRSLLKTKQRICVPRKLSQLMTSTQTNCKVYNDVTPYKSLSSTEWCQQKLHGKSLSLTWIQNLISGQIA